MKTMTRWLSMVLVLVMVLSMVACGQPQASVPAEGGQLAVQNNAADNTVAPGNGVEPNTEDTRPVSTQPVESTNPPDVVGDEAENDSPSADKTDEQTDNHATNSNSNTTAQNKGNTATQNGNATAQEKNDTPEQNETPAPEQNETPAPEQNENPAPEQNETPAPEQSENTIPEQNENTAPEQTENTDTIAPVGEYNPGIVLVKVKNSFNSEDLGTLAYVSAEPLYAGSKWYCIKLADATKTEEAVTYLTGLGNFASVDYDYIMSTCAETDSVDVSCNPDYDKQKHHQTHKISEGWQYTIENGKNPGGSSDVVIAIIDTGVDYNHLDLRNNIWINTAEIPDNGRDDDGNGYIDDIYGWDCVGNDKDPMDDNGHGTHVAGIVAAENNDIGGVGIAYNCKIMVLKAGNSSGSFNNSDIAEAIQYAYMNGASVINMSFGGSNISIAVEEALENAYNACVLVAAAGNDGVCNNLSCTKKNCNSKAVTYPAALPYVIGVMSVSQDGTRVSGFSNYDHDPYNSVEYEVYAVGENVPSCWPGNRYATLNGTSMAAPAVAGMAALLRSYYSDREMYSTKFIQSQIVNTGTVYPYSDLLEDVDEAHAVADIQAALTKLPKPAVNLYDYHIDDSTAISSKNNGNGVIDAGETIRLYVSLHNRGGVASNVNVSIDANRGEGIADAYFTFVNPSIQLSDIGTYSVRESGDKYFKIVVSGDCPNDYIVDFNIHYTYTNGMDEKDTAVYADDGKQKAQCVVSSGYHLPAIISEDTTFTNDRLYIVGETLTIPVGVTVTFEEGCRIQFYDDREYYNSPRFVVYGTLNMEGTKEKMVRIYPSESLSNFACIIENQSVVNLNYISATNLYTVGAEGTFTVLNSQLRKSASWVARYYKNGQEVGTYSFAVGKEPHNNIYSNNYIELTLTDDFITGKLDGNYIVAAQNSRPDIEACDLFSNNLVYSYHIDGHTGDPGSLNLQGETTNNFFITSDNEKMNTLLYFRRSEGNWSNNTFSAGYQKYISQVVEGYYDANGNPTIDAFGSCSDISKLWPYVVSVEMFDADGNPITTVGNEAITVRVTFNRPMDTTKETYLTFGTIEPYADYRIDGAYISDTVWEGSYALKAQIENGQNFLKVEDACAAEDPTKTVFGQYQLHEFTIDTTAAMAMNLQAITKAEGIELTFAQDDYDTLLGYNIYRSEDKDGNFVKLNSTVVLPDETTFLDDNAEPGKTYWYTYTVVLSDFTESNPAGKVVCAAMDTMSPVLYHTPVNQGYAGNNLVIACTASDNVAISAVTLYYRSVGETAWKSLTMSRTNDKFSATVFGSEVTLAGLEYYILASDGINTVAKGSAETPYTVLVKDASAISRVGDVDGNGSITTKDALMLMQCLNGDLILSDDAFKRADLNGDGVLSSAEALRILQYVNGKVATLEM